MPVSSRVESRKKRYCACHHDTNWSLEIEELIASDRARVGAFERLIQKLFL